VFSRLRRRVGQSNERHAKAKNDAAVEKFLREQEKSEREKAGPVESPPGRSNTDWTYLNP
jgi:hypothetical protein